MPIVAENYRFVVGVDTHAATHSYAIVAASGALIDQRTFPTTAAGLARAAAWIDGSASTPAEVLIAAEGSNSYGAVMAEQLAKAGYRVVEAPTPSAKRLRGKGKTDAMDALTAARAALVLELDQLRDRRGGEVQTALKVLSVAREQLSAERLRLINTVTALLRSHDLGLDTRTALSDSQITQVAGWRDRQEGLGLATARAEAVRQARRVLELDQILTENERRLHTLIKAYAPELLALAGVGPVSAGIVLTAWSHPGRIRTEAAMAMLAGTCPIPASSGNVQRHRLNRGGDRQLNKAMHTIARSRTLTDAATKTYIERRRAEGKTDREIRRCLKRYITRKLFRTLKTLDIAPAT